VFALLAAAFDLQSVARGKIRGATEPAGEHGFPAEAAGLAGKDDEDGLCDFFGQMRIPHLPERSGVNEGDVAIDELRERGLGLAGGVFGKQFAIALHLTY
jgi:hypothetical protein